MRLTSRRNEHGAIAILFAASATFLFILAAIVVDLGLARETRRDSQNAADASALAAANVLYPPNACAEPVGSSPPCLTDAVNAAKTYAAVNFGVEPSDWAACSVPPTGYLAHDNASRCVSFDSLTAPTRVWVMMPDRDVRTGLGALAGVDTIAVGAAARASVVAGQEMSCGLCFLGDIDTVKFDVKVEGDGVAINGNVTNNMGDWNASAIQVLDPDLTDSKLNATPDPTPTDPFPDPWATKAGVPPAVSGPDKGTTNPCAGGGGPGRYSAVDLPNGTCALAPGLYVITGLWEAKNSTVITGNDVTLYFTCGTSATPVVCAAGGQAGGSLDMKNGDIAIKAPTSGFRAGLAIIYDRGNTSPLSLQGNGEVSKVAGAIYAPRAVLHFNGNSKFKVEGGPVILKGALGNGTTGVWITATNGAVIGEVPPQIALDK